MAIGGYSGLGYDAYVDVWLPAHSEVGHFKQNFSIDLNKYATDAVNQNWPVVDAEIQKIPGVINQNWPAIHAAIQKQVPTLLAKAADLSVDQAITKMWPLVDAQIQQKATQFSGPVISDVRKVVFIGVGILSLAIIAGAWFARGGGK
jgi:hypothetical protein